MLQFDHNGALIPPAKLNKRWAEDFEMGTLPPWLTPGSTTNDANSTRTFLDRASTRGGLQLTTAATASARSTIVAPAIKLDLCAAIAIRVRFTGVFPLNQASLVIGCYNDPTQSDGFAFRKLSTTSGSQLVAYRKTTGGAAVNTFDTLSFESMGDTVKTHDITLILDCADREIYLTEYGYQVKTTWKPGLAANVVDPIALGVVTPFVRIVTADAVARSMIVHNFEVERWMR